MGNIIYFMTLISIILFVIGVVTSDCVSALSKLPGEDINRKRTMSRITCVRITVFSISLILLLVVAISVTNIYMYIFGFIILLGIIESASQYRNLKKEINSVSSKFSILEK